MNDPKKDFKFPTPFYPFSISKSTLQNYVKRLKVSQDRNEASNGLQNDTLEWNTNDINTFKLC